MEKLPVAMSVRANHECDSCNILGVRPIDADLVWASWVFTQIFDVAKDVTTTILTDEVSEVCTQTHIRHL